MTAPTIRWPISFADAVLAEMKLADLPLDAAALVRQAESQAYARGHLDAMRCLVDDRRLSLLDSDWREQAMAMRAEQIRHRDECAQARADARREALNVAAGRHPGYRYRGGAVDWNTGMPVGSACAWLRNKRERDAEGATVTPIRSARRVGSERQAAA